MATRQGTSTKIGSGSDTLVLKVTQDAYKGDAQYAVYVDGKQVGGTVTAKALHNSGQFDTLEIKGDWSAGNHNVSVKLLNDLYHGSPTKDRNLYVESATYNGAAVSGSNLYVNSPAAKGFTFVDIGNVITPAPSTSTPNSEAVPAPTATSLVGGMAAELGVYVGNNPKDVARFEELIGRPVDGVLAYTGSSNGWTGVSPDWQIRDSGLGGADRDLHWSIQIGPDTGNGVAVLREIAAGQHDAKFRDFAKQMLAADSGTDPIYVRYGWEIGGEWFWWTHTANSDPEAFRGAFRHFADAFHGESDRFKIVWDTAADRDYDMNRYYPGDQYVDVVSRDIYWNPQWSSYDLEKAWEWYTTGMNNGLQDLADFAAEHGKPMAISEWGVPGDNTAVDSAGFIGKMRDWINSHNVVYADYWDSTEGGDRLLSDHNPAAAAAALRDFY